MHDDDGKLSLVMGCCTPAAGASDDPSSTPSATAATGWASLHLSAVHYLRGIRSLVGYGCSSAISSTRGTAALLLAPVFVLITIHTAPLKRAAANVVVVAPSIILLCCAVLYIYVVLCSITALICSVAASHHHHHARAMRTSSSAAKSQHASYIILVILLAGMNK